MKNLTLVKQSAFGKVKCDIYSDEKNMFMTAEQLSNCLEYSNRKGIDNLIARNPYLNSDEFSVTLKLRATDGKQYNTRVFTEDGIYEVTFLSKTKKAREFRAWIRKLLKSLRQGEIKIVGMSDYQRMMIETRTENARIRKAQILTKIAGEYSGTYRQVLQAHATLELTGEYLLPLPKIDKRTYTATEIGDKLGITANKVGILANKNNLKTDEYGAWYNDKAKNCNKEVPTFRYYEDVIPVLARVI